MKISTQLCKSIEDGICKPATEVALLSIQSFELTLKGPVGGREKENNEQSRRNRPSEAQPRGGVGLCGWSPGSIVETKEKLG